MRIQLRADSCLPGRVVSSVIGQTPRFTTDVAVALAALFNWATQLGRSEGHDQPDQEWTEEPKRLQGDVRVDLEAP